MQNERRLGLDEVPGPIVLFGSGEAAPSARRAHAAKHNRVDIRQRNLRDVIAPGGFKFDVGVVDVGKQTSEIIRRRLFDWDGTLDGDGKKTVTAYAEWVTDHRQQVPSWFPLDHACEAFEAAYPFHPMTLSVC